MEDSDFNDPLPAPGAADSGASGSSEPSAELIGNLTMLGFTDEQARAALLSTGNSPERGAEWLFSRMDNMDAAVAEALAAVDGGGGAAAAAADAGPVDDGPGKYSLFGIVSHLGKNTGCGHYVAHVKKNGRWVIFNDRKVGLSKAPPLDVGYMYFYKRNE
jgi:ubiquitin carboxyl-terminal hydrolase 5/13